MQSPEVNGREEAEKYRATAIDVDDSEANIVKSPRRWFLSPQREIIRHGDLCTAIPFPDLDWSTDRACDASLAALYRYAETLAHSVIDWYLAARSKKKRLSITLRGLSYLFFILGAAVPLLRIFSPHLEDAVFSALLGAAPDGSAFSAEGSLVLIGAGGVFALADKLSGASVGWRRYISTALQLDRMLLEFRLEWNAYPAKAGAMEPDPGIARTDDTSRLSRSIPEAPAEREVDERFPMPLPHGYIELRYATVSRFCLSVLTVVRDETIGWAEEFTRSASEFEQQLHSGIFGGTRRS
jgi:hypothetical protein